MSLKPPVTAAVRFLRDHKVDYSVHLYSYEDQGGTAVASRELNLPEHQIIKTIVMEDELKRAIIVLMHGDREVSTKNLARILEVKRIVPCDPKVVNKHTAYLVGGTSPFGTKNKLPVIMQQSIQLIEKAYINGGKRGFLVGVKPSDVEILLKPKIVEIAV